MPLLLLGIDAATALEMVDLLDGTILKVGFLQQISPGLPHLLASNLYIPRTTLDF